MLIIHKLVMAKHFLHIGFIDIELFRLTYVLLAIVPKYVLYIKRSHYFLYKTKPITVLIIRTTFSRWISNPLGPVHTYIRRLTLLELVQAAIPLKFIYWHLPEPLVSMPAVGFSPPTNVDFY